VWERLIVSPIEKPRWDVGCDRTLNIYPGLLTHIRDHEGGTKTK